MKHIFIVEIEAPKGMPQGALMEYIHVELGAARGHFHPDDPRHDIARTDITVRVATPARLRAVADDLETKAKRRHRGQEA